MSKFSLDIPVRAYWNLHKKKWSLQDRKTGRVFTHVDAITLADGKFVVRPAGQAKVRREGKKNVHAFAVGDVSLRNGFRQTDNSRRVKYNPYVDDTFVFEDTGESVTEAYIITLCIDRSNNKPVVWATENVNG
jgi:hypothetical protein